MRLTGNMVVPTNMIVMGSKLYSSQLKNKTDDPSALFVPLRKQFGLKVHATIFAMRMIVLPFMSRVFFRMFNMWALPGEILDVYSLVNFAVPTASNVVMVFVVMARLMPSVGSNLEEDVATTIFYQYLAVPLFFTLNTALSLDLVFNQGPVAAAAAAGKVLAAAGKAVV